MANGLVQNSSIEKLVMSNCGIGNGTGDALGKAVAQLATLKSLEYVAIMSCHGITESGTHLGYCWAACMEMISRLQVAMRFCGAFSRIDQ